MQQQIRELQRGRRGRRRHARPPQGPARPRLAPPRRRRDRRRRRGRPHGRHGLPARGPSPARHGATTTARRCSSRPRSTATSTCSSALPAQPGPPRGRVARGAGRGHAPLLARAPARPRRGGHGHRRAAAGRPSCSPARSTAPSVWRSSSTRPASAPRPSTAIAASRQRERALADFGRARRARARRHRRRRPRHPRRRRRVRAAVRPARGRQGLRPPLRAHGPRRPGRDGHHARHAREGQGGCGSALRRREPLEDAPPPRPRFSVTPPSHRPRRWARRRAGRERARAAPERPRATPATVPPGPPASRTARAQRTSGARAPGGRPVQRSGAGGHRLPLRSPRRAARPTTRRCRSRPPGPPRRRQRTPTLALGPGPHTPASPAP